MSRPQSLYFLICRAMGDINLYAVIPQVLIPVTTPNGSQKFSLCFRYCILSYGKPSNSGTNLTDVSGCFAAQLGSG
jgi:hypothetical protein